MTVKETAALLGWSEGYVRHACRTGTIGEAYSGGKGKRYACVVYEDKVAERRGVSVDELRELVEELRTR